MFKEKLHKNLASSLEEHGFIEPKAIQLKSLSKINAGQDVIGIGPDHTGKSTTIVISAIQKLKHAFEDAPRVLILVADADMALAMKEQFLLLSKHTDLRIHCTHEGGKIDKQGEEIYSGSDIVIGTPKRSFDLYLKQHLNLNKIKLFVIDDAELMIKLAYQGQIDRLILSLPKCQHLVFTNNYDDKVERLIEKFIVAPAIIEVQD